MGGDDDLGCVEHVWQFGGATLTTGISLLEYRSTRCTATTLMQPWSPTATHTVPIGQFVAVPEGVE